MHTGPTTFDALTPGWARGLVLAFSLILAAGFVRAETPADEWETAPDAAADADSAGDEAETAKSPPRERLMRLNYIATPWPSVLKRVANESGLTLVMRKAPGGKFNRTDLKKYTPAEALRELNRELEPTGFRLIRQNDFLVVLALDDLRSEYGRPVMRQRRAVDKSTHDAPQRDQASERDEASQGTARRASGVRSAAETVPDDAAERRTAGSARTRRAAPGRVEQASFDESDNAPVDNESPAPAAPTFVAVRNGKAAVIARRMYQALKARAEIFENGPGGLPSFRVFEPGAASQSAPAAHGSRVSFTMGVDAERNRLAVQAAQPRRAALVRAIERLDRPADRATGDFQLVSADEATCAIASNLGPQLDRLIAQRDDVEQRVPMPRTSPPGARGNAQPEPVGEKGISEIIKGLKGNVTVESIPEMGILILRGSQPDVDAVMRVIREIERLGAGSTPQIHVLPLQYVNSESFAELLNEVYKELSNLRSTDREAKQTIHIFAIVKPNAVLVLAPPADMQGVLKLAKELDRPVDPTLEFQVFRLHHGIAQQVAKALTDFYKARKGLGAKVNAIPDPRTNSVVVQAPGRDLAEVAKLVDQLDGPTATTGTVKVFTLQNGDASAIQRLLESLFGEGSTRTAQNNAGEETNESALITLRFSADVRTNSIIAVGSPESLRAVEAIILRLDNSDVHQRQTVVIRLKNNSSDAVARAVDQFIRSQREISQIDPELISSVELLEREIFVVSEPVSNTLLLSATPRYFDDLKRMIDKLDAPPAQVIIQALLVEVELDNTDEFGIELGFQDSVLFDRSELSQIQKLTTTTTLTNGAQTSTERVISEQADPGFRFGDPAQGLGLNPAVNSSRVGGQQLANFGLGRINNELGFGGLVLSASSESVSALLRALSYKRTLHVLSRPQIRTLDNRMATIQVGQNVPIVIGGNAQLNGSISPVIRYDPAGIILTVQPRIAPDGMIVLEAYAEKSAFRSVGVPIVTDEASGRTIQSPIKDVTRAEASVSVASGNTVVMGGMIVASDDTVQRKVPCIGDLPLVGQLFRYDSKVTKRTELLIFLTPRVIREDVDDETIKQIESERLHFLMDEAEAVHGPILSCKPPESGGEVAPAPLTNGDGTIGPSLVNPPAPGLFPMLPAPPEPGDAIDDSNVPTTVMPPAADRDVKLFPAAPQDRKSANRRTGGDEADSVQFADEPTATSVPTTSLRGRLKKIVPAGYQAEKPTRSQ